MHQARPVHVEQRLRGAGSQHQHRRNRQRTVLDDRLFQGRTRYVGVASQGVAASGSASSRGTVYLPLTACAAATSRRKRIRKVRSASFSGRMTLTATACPYGEVAR